MTTGAESVGGPRPRSGRTSAREQARQKGLRPLASLEDLQADVWETDGELDEFLRHIEASRHGELS